MKNKEKEVDFSEQGFKKRFKPISRRERPAITLKDETKDRITIYLDAVVVTHYKQMAKELNIGYQTLINRALLETVQNKNVLPEHVKESLLKDEQFLLDLKTALAI